MRTAFYKHHIDAFEIPSAKIKTGYDLTWGFAYDHQRGKIAHLCTGFAIGVSAGWSLQMFKDDCNLIDGKAIRLLEKDRILVNYENDLEIYWKCSLP